MESNAFLPFLAFSLALFISWLLLPPIIRLARTFRLFEKNNFRKVHTESVCSLGGIASFSGFWIALLVLTSVEQFSRLRILILGSFILLLVHLMDDLIGVKVFKRFAIQILLGIALAFSGTCIDLSTLPWAVPDAFGVVLTVLVFLALINAYNFIDGINGLAGGLAVIGATTLGFLFAWQDATLYSLIAFAFAGAKLGFLRFNFGRAKIFMGDNGSTLLGLVFTFLSISYWNLQTGKTGMFDWPSLLILFSVVAIPLIDLIKVTLVRLLRGKSPFYGDRTHVHHQLLTAGWKQNEICLLLYALNLGAITLSIQMVPYLPLPAFIGIVVLAAAPYYIAYKFSLRIPEEEVILLSQQPGKPDKHGPLIHSRIIEK